MTKVNAVKEFKAISRPYNDYWEMQLNWTVFMDRLYSEGQITMKQRDNWGNPCTPETFKRFNKTITGDNIE